MHESEFARHRSVTEPVSTASYPRHLVSLIPCSTPFSATCCHLYTSPRGVPRSHLPVPLPNDRRRLLRLPPSVAVSFPPIVASSLPSRRSHRRRVRHLRCLCGWSQKTRKSILKIPPTETLHRSMLCEAFTAGRVIRLLRPSPRDSSAPHLLARWIRSRLASATMARRRGCCARPSDALITCRRLVASSPPLNDGERQRQVFIPLHYRRQTTSVFRRNPRSPSCQRSMNDGRLPIDRLVDSDLVAWSQRHNVITHCDVSKSEIEATVQQTHRFRLRAGDYVTSGSGSHVRHTIPHVLKQNIQRECAKRDRCIVVRVSAVTAEYCGAFVARHLQRLQ